MKNLNPVLALDIGGKNIKAVQGTCISGYIYVDKAISFKTPENSIKNDIVIAPELLSESISSALQQADINVKEAIVTINAKDAITKEMSLPPAKYAETAEMVRLEMLQNYHVSSTSVIQYKKINKGNREDENDQLLDYRAAVLERDLVDSYYKMLTNAKLSPIAMDLNFNVIDKLFSQNLLVNKKAINTGATMLVDIGDSLTTVFMVAPGKPTLFRHLDYGGGNIEKFISMKTLEPVEKIRKMKEEGYDFFAIGQEANYYELLEPYLFDLIDKVRRFIRFYISVAGSANMNQIYLFGGCSYMTGFAKYCEDSFDVPTEQITDVSHIKLKDPDIPVALYLNAISALIRN